MTRATLFFLFACTLGRAAETVAVAAAANLVFAIESLQAEFKRIAPEIVITSTTGASGTLYTQIRNGAPFDVFLSADTDYPRQLVTSGDAATLRVFAIGRLVVWTTRSGLDLSELAAAVRLPAVSKIAMPQPAAAPYGRAARAVLEKVGVWQEAQAKLVFGESVSQTAQFIETGNADWGFVALSLVKSPRLLGQGHWVEVLPAFYAGVSLEHGAVLTKRGAKNAAARRYLDFLISEPAQKILRDFGYGVP